MKLDVSGEMREAAVKVVRSALENQRVVVAMADHLSLSLWVAQPLLRASLVGATDTEAEANQLIRDEKATMLVVEDGALAQGYGLRVVKENRAINSLVIVGRETTDAVNEAVEAGANGIILRSQINDGRGELLPALSSVAASGTYVTKAVSGLEKADTELRERLLAELTERELETLRLLASGMTNGELCEAMSVSMDTVKSHVKAINQKTHAENRVALALMAIRAELG